MEQTKEKIPWRFVIYKLDLQTNRICFTLLYWISNINTRIDISFFIYLKKIGYSFLLLYIKYSNIKHSLVVIYDPNEVFFEIIWKHIEILASFLLLMGRILTFCLSIPVIQIYKGERIIKKQEREIEFYRWFWAWPCRCVERASSVSRFTWHGPQSKQARLDYFLVSSFPQKFTVNADIWYACRSDYYQLKFLLKMKINHVGKEVKHFTTVYFMTKVSASYNVLINNI